MVDLITPRYFVLRLNPEPWAVGDAYVGRSNGKVFARIGPNPNLAAYQQAVKEALSGEQKLSHVYDKFTFYFWRQRAQYLDAADHKRTRNIADATNMQKALEDALQGVLIGNDRNNRDVRSIIVQQGVDVQPAIVIKAQAFDVSDLVLPADVMNQLTEPSAPKVSDNSWPPK